MKNSNILFRGKYRIASTRLPSWNYADQGFYFITICTQHRRHFFGEIIQGEVHLSEIGCIAFEEWIKTPILRPDMNLQLGKFVIMPNHFHAIIGIGANEFNSDTGTGRDAMLRVSVNENAVNRIFPEDAKHHVSQRINHNETTICGDAKHHVSQQINHNETTICVDAKHRVSTGPQTKNLASIVRGFKSAVTIQARKQGHNFQWQARYHDHIIRTETAFQHISNYIEQNPVNWYKDSLM